MLGDMQRRQCSLPEGAKPPAVSLAECLPGNTVCLLGLGLERHFERWKDRWGLVLRCQAWGESVRCQGRIAVGL